MIKKNQILIAVFAVLFSLLYLRLIHLQFVEHNKLDLLAIANAAKNVPEPAPRGVIYDRYGKVLVESRPVFSVRVLPYVLANKSERERERILGLLSQLLGEKVELKVSATEPLLVKDNVPLTTAIRITEKKRDLDGVVVNSHPIRLSNYGSTASHLLGYVGEIEAEELEKLRGRGYRMGDIIGKDGVEKNYDALIRGIDGGQKVEVDVHGTPLRMLESLDPESGPDVKLTIDLELQQAAEMALGRKEGAVLIMDTKTGEILAMANYPNYDPNIFSDPMVNYKWKELKKQKHPFMNRALAHYPPGSIFKVITIAAALEEGKAKWDEIMDCRGYYKVNRRVAKCWLQGGHGPVSVREGLVWSCDVVFYELGRRLGPDLIAKYADKFGLGKLTGIDLPQEKMGKVPTTKWKEEYFKEPWYEGDSINYGIGQGWVQVTPLQMAVVYAALASGNIYKPFVVAEIKGRNGEILYTGKSEVVERVSVSSKTLELIRGVLHDVVDRATGVAVRFAGVPAAGKTGTAENPGKAHAWFICYAPYENPEIVIAAFVAHGEHGDRAPAYIARDILKWYKEHRLKDEYEITPYAGQYILQREKYKSPYGKRPEKKVEEEAVVEGEDKMTEELLF
ncbi:MAG: penicillin-binding protein 2 [Candidatus Margulisiibacteriota bacterium]